MIEMSQIALVTHSFFDDYYCADAGIDVDDFFVRSQVLSELLRQNEVPKELLLTVALMLYLPFYVQISWIVYSFHVLVMYSAYLLTLIKC